MQLQGFGSLSFFIPETKQFVALGHGIIDSDTNSLLEIDNGNLTTTKIISINKGVSGNPGEIRGTVNDDNIGDIETNSNFGIFGNLSEEKSLEYQNSDKVQIGLRSEIELGKAVIMSNFSGEMKEYEVMIDKIYLDDVEDNKSFVVRITDKDLINKTGGIIRGLSGSPILQNGKLIGIVTNVLVSNPRIGFGVFADLILENMNIY